MSYQPHPVSPPSIPHPSLSLSPISSPVSSEETQTKKKSFTIDNLLGAKEEEAPRMSPIKVPALPAQSLMMEQHLLRLHTLQMLANAHRLSSSLPAPFLSSLTPPSSSSSVTLPVSSPSHFLDHSLETPTSSSPTSRESETSFTGSEQSPEVRRPESEQKVEIKTEPEEPAGGIKTEEGQQSSQTGEGKSVGVRFSPDLRSI